jgi:hypothetical protein
MGYEAKKTEHCGPPKKQQRPTQPIAAKKERLCFQWLLYGNRKLLYSNFPRGDVSTLTRRAAPLLQVWTASHAVERNARLHTAEAEAFDRYSLSNLQQVILLSLAEFFLFG